MIRRRPIPRSDYHWTSKPKPCQSLRYQLSDDGFYLIYPDGREVCVETAAGRREYARRVQVMAQRQNYRCSLCGTRLNVANATFEHQRRRGMGAAFRDDRIIDARGNWMNSAAHWVCNRKRG